MSLCKRIIPCLDVDGGRVVKGTHFVDIRDAGDPVACAARYNEGGADELTFLDISASVEGRTTTLQMVEQVASEVFIPLTVGGGVRTLDDIRRLLNAGADKVAINSAAVQNPDLVATAAAHFGNQCIVVAIDARRVGEQWHVYTHGGRQDSGLDAVQWARTMVDAGAGELLVTSMDRDGTRSGFDNALLKNITADGRVPVIASGGVGTLAHLAAGILEGGCDAVLAASIFHFGEYTIAAAKDYLAERGIPVRPIDQA